MTCTNHSLTAHTMYVFSTCAHAPTHTYACAYISVSVQLYSTVKLHVDSDMLDGLGEDDGEGEGILRRLQEGLWKKKFDDGNEEADG